MAAPTFIQEAETAWNTTTTPKTTGSFSIEASDVLVAFAITPDNLAQVSTPTNSGAALTWTLQQQVAVTSYTHTSVWTAIGDSSRSITVSFTRTGTNLVFGGNVLTFRGSDGVGASSKTNVDEPTNGPTLNLTTTQANSAIVVANGDWDALDGASRTWRTNAGALTEVSYFRNTVDYAIYGGYHANAEAIGTYAVGLSAPTTQKYSIVAVEVKGTADLLMPQIVL